MSAKQTGIVWELDLPHNLGYVLMAMADHADHDGGNIFPSMPYIAWKTGYKERHVRRLVKQLREAGILIPTQAWHGHAKRYRMETSHVPRKPAFEKRKTGESTPDKMSPLTFCHPVPQDRHNHQSTNTKRVVENKSISRDGEFSLFDDDSDFDSEGDFE